MSVITESIDKFVGDQKATTVATPLPCVAQRDNDCGIFALGAAIARRGVQVPPRKVVGTDYSAPVAVTFLPNFFSASTVEGAMSVRELAKKHGYTTLGELFDARQVADLASRCGCTDAKCVSVDAGIFFDTIKSAIDGDKTVMVPYSSLSGEPGTVGDRAHWCLVIGYYDETATKHVIAAHRAKYWDWTAKDLIDSNLSLKAWAETEYGKDNPSDWNPKGAKKGPFLDERTIKAAALNLTLRGFIVVI